MNNTLPLLSICIPTYNRSGILYANLKKLLELPAFDEEVELVVSDNASTDNTQEMVGKLQCEYPLKQICYYRNEENVRDRNFLLALSRGQGSYLKLLNDYTSFSNEDLALMKKKVRAHLDDGFCLFFVDKPKYFPSGIKEVQVESVDELVRKLSNKMTWISNFGCFRWQVAELGRFQEKAHLMILQMIWILHLVSQTGKALIIGIYSYSPVPVGAKDRVPYNLFTPHVANYYAVLDDYVKRGIIHPLTIRKDKSHVLHDYVGAQIKNYLFFPKDESFDLTGGWRIVWKHFHSVPYLYVLCLKGGFHYCQRKIRLLFSGRNLFRDIPQDG